MQFSRRAFVSAAVLASGMPFDPVFGQSAPAPQTPRFGFSDVVTRARDLAGAPFDPRPTPPPDVQALGIQAWQQIRFRSDHAFLADAGLFRMELFHLGGRFKQPVTINIVRDGIATPIPYATNLFDYGSVTFDRPLPINLGFAGFRLRFPLNRTRVFDEIAAFLGASYYRFLGRGQRYGLSARGLAVNAGEPDEEFPFFREFWIQAPKANDASLQFYALLDGPSVTGAYEFTLQPRRDTRLDVTASLFARQPGRKIGMAPLTSMYCAGENDRRVHDDYRPERHDSDGLLIHTGANEWIWRPLRNPIALATSSFLDPNTQAFGLLQRDRDFEHYQDLDRLYNVEPSYWVRPLEAWGPGRVELIELPTTDDQNDNVVASFVADAPLAPGAPRTIRYRIEAIYDAPDPSPNGRVANTFLTAAPQAHEPPAGGAIKRFLVDFEGGDLGYYMSAPERVSAVPSALNGRILSASVAPIRATGGFRATIDALAPAGQSCDLRLFLRADGQALTETWTLPWAAA